MPLVATDNAPAIRTRVVRVYLTQGVVGLVVLGWFTFTRTSETVMIWEALGESAPILLVLFYLYTFSLGSLKFALTEQMFVALVFMAFTTMVPILGLVMASWLAVFATISSRLFDRTKFGPNPVDPTDRRMDSARTFGLFGVLGVPVVVATLTYQSLGGEIPISGPSLVEVGRIFVAAVTLMVVNNLVFYPSEWAYGLPLSTSLRHSAIDAAVYLLSVPYVIMTILAWSAMGWGAILGSAFTGILVNWVGRRLALSRAANELQIRRLASLTNIGKAISISSTPEQLLMALHTECRKVIDVSMFSVALVDDERKELKFELDIRRDEVLPKFRVTLGEGLNSWVVENQQPLLLGSAAEEQSMGLSSVDDGMATESWLGVPMISRDQVIGAISVQSYRKNAFNEDDIVLLTAIANQAAVALKNANLYQDLEGLNAGLEHRVLDRTNELREANLRLISADRSKNQFLANMSHELRTPLNSIIGFSTILLDATRDNLSPRLYKFIENIRASGSHLLVLINDILDLSKIEAGRLELQAESFDLRDTLSTVERVMKGIAAENHVSIVSTVSDEVPMVHLDESRIKQILLNLLSNAVKFSSSGGFVYVNVALVSGGGSPIGVNAVRVEVRDEGVGIPADELPRIFDEFYQVHETRRARKGGTGLGLSLTKAFTELHHGRIDVTSRPGKGSTFTIHLPVDHAVAVAMVVANRAS